ncbi:unnamed protein product, partial [Mesorhabditis belari]|uniref:Uncharacterized protein n=1 Tax=Mesorhabditis belari TaxID=2138241 RepID=A0AAF3FJV1_9BILA
MLKRLIVVAFYFTNFVFLITNATETAYTFDLCRPEPVYQFHDLTGDFLESINDTVLYHLNSTSCKREITGFYQESVNGYEFEVFEGGGMTGTNINMTEYLGGTKFTHDAGEISVRIKLTGNPIISFHMLFTAIEGSVQFFGGSYYHTNGELLSILKYDPSPIVIYMGHSSYQIENGIGLEYSGDLKFEMYHGLSLDQNDLIYGENLTATGCTAQNIRPRFVYGSYVVLKLLKTTATGTIKYTHKTNSNYMMMSIPMTATNSLETPPCPKVNKAQLHECSYTLSYGGSGNRRAIGMDLLAPIRTDSYLQIMEYNGETLLSDNTYYSNSSYCGFMTNATSAIVNYYYQCKPDTLTQREFFFQYRVGDEIPDGDKAGGSISYLISLVLFFVLVSIY